MPAVANQFIVSFDTNGLKAGERLNKSSSAMLFY